MHKKAYLLQEHGDCIPLMKTIKKSIDQNNIIQYVDFVPGGGLPNIKKALEAARDLLNISKSKS